MTTLHITWPPHHPRENPSLIDLAREIGHHVGAVVLVRNSYPGPRLVTHADQVSVETAAHLFLDAHPIKWQPTSWLRRDDAAALVAEEIRLTEAAS